MISSEYYGYNDIEELNAINSDVCLTFKIPVEHVQHWKKCSLIANFFGNYQAESYKNNKSQIVSIISTISNELLENAIKFSEKKYSDVGISIKKHQSSILIQVENVTNFKNTEKLKHTLHRIENENISALQLDKITKNERFNQEESEIGLINIAKDFTTKVGAKICPIESTQLYKVEIYVIFNDSTYLS